MTTKKLILEKYISILDCLKESKNQLRFDRGAVGISDIGQQYFCEKELELDYEYPDEETEGMSIGKIGHENVSLLAVDVTKEEAIEQAVRSGKEPTIVCEFGVAWLFKGVPVMGQLDEALFQNGRVMVVSERKFTDSLRPYMDHHVQARQYCLALDGMGFDTSSTSYSIMTFTRSCHDCVKLIERSCGIFDRVHDSLRCKKGEVKVFSFVFDKGKALMELNWALDFWLKNREAIPTNNIAKCRSCRRRYACNLAA